MLMACAQGDLATVELLLSLGADPALQGNAFFEAARREKTRRPNIEAEDADADADSEEEEEEEEEEDRNRRIGMDFPLNAAAREGHVALVRLLSAHRKVNINAVYLQSNGAKQNTALLTACLSGHTDVVAELLKHPEVS